MKLFDENGTYIGSISDEEYKESCEAIMPVPVPVKQPKVYIPSSAFRVFPYVFFLGGLIFFVFLGFHVAGIPSEAFGFILNQFHAPFISAVFLGLTLILYKEHRALKIAFRIRIAEFIMYLLLYLNEDLTLSLLVLEVEIAAIILTAYGMLKCIQLPPNQNKNLFIWVAFTTQLLLFFALITVKLSTFTFSPYAIYTMLYYVITGYLFYYVNKKGVPGGRYESI